MSRAPQSVSVKDVAARAGVSLGTVSNVLNRPDRVSERTRSRVENAMLELGFVRNESARQLRNGQSRVLAYVVLDAANPFFTDVAQGVDEAAEANDLRLFTCNSYNSIERERAYLELLQQQRVQGILITPVNPDADHLRAVNAGGVSLVLVDRTTQGAELCSVSVDDVLGGRLAVEHLIDRGHTRVAVVGGPLTTGQVRDRWQGAREAWADAGLPTDSLRMIPTTALTVAEGRGAGERLSGLSSRRRPTAAFCTNDLLALGLLQQAISSGRRVPEELAIVGYDDIEFAAAAAVPLTSVRQPRQELGRTATRLAVDEATNPDHEHSHIAFTPELIARTSTLG